MEWGAPVGTPGTFVLSGSVGAAGYRWSVNGGATTAVKRGPISYTPLTDMVHLMSVSAFDIAGNTSPTVRHDIWVTPLPNRCWHWRMNEESGTTAADSGRTDPEDLLCASDGTMPEPQDATLSGAVTFGPGYLDNAATFTGPGQILAPGAVIDPADSFTVMAWVRASDLDVSRSLLSQDGTTASRFSLGYRREANDGAGGWCFSLSADQSGAAPAQVCATGRYEHSKPVPNRWVHLAGTYDVHLNRLQVHVMGNQGACGGEMASTAVAAGGAPAAGSFVLGRGLESGSAANRWLGSIDHVYAHQQVLSDAEICQQAIQ